MRRQPLDIEAIKRRLQVSFTSTDRRGKLYLALAEARTDCAALLDELARRDAALVEMALFFTRRIAELESQPHGQPMNPSRGAVNDAPTPLGLAQTSTASGAGPPAKVLGAREPDQRDPPT